MFSNCGFLIININDKGVCGGHILYRYKKVHRSVPSSKIRRFKFWRHFSGFFLVNRLGRPGRGRRLGLHICQLYYDILRDMTAEEFVFGLKSSDFPAEKIVPDLIKIFHDLDISSNLLALCQLALILAYRLFQLDNLLFEFFNFTSDRVHQVGLDQIL